MGELVPSRSRNGAASIKAIVAAFKEQKAKEVVDQKKNTKTARLARLQEPMSPEQLSAAKLDLEKFAESVGEVDVHEERRLNRTELLFLMKEYKALEQAELLAKARKERIKSMVFNHIGDEAGNIPVGDRKFCKEGGGQSDPTVDEKALREHLGADWAKVSSVQHIPAVAAQTIETLDDAKLEKYLQKNPEAIEIVREVLIPGSDKPFRFTVRANDDPFA